MPHVVYYAPFLLCPWPACGFRIEMIDFQLEKMATPDLYARVVAAWGRQPGYGVVGRCPGCGQYVWFGKRTASKPCWTLQPPTWKYCRMTGLRTRSLAEGKQ